MSRWHRRDGGVVASPSDELCDFRRSRTCIRSYGRPDRPYSCRPVDGAYPVYGVERTRCHQSSRRDEPRVRGAVRGEPDARPAGPTGSAPIRPEPTADPPQRCRPPPAAQGFWSKARRRRWAPPPAPSGFSGASWTCSRTGGNLVQATGVAAELPDDLAEQALGDEPGGERRERHHEQDEQVDLQEDRIRPGDARAGQCGVEEPCGAPSPASSASANPNRRRALRNNLPLNPPGTDGGPGPECGHPGRVMTVTSDLSRINRAATGALRSGRDELWRQPEGSTASRRVVVPGPPRYDLMGAHADERV